MSDVTDDRYPIDELARRTGMTARNIRAYQSRGLVPPPEVRGRTGYYGPEHVARIELIKELQAEGFNLEAIRHLIENAGGSSGEVLRFTRAAREAFEDEEPEILPAEELAERFGGADPELLRRAVGLGVLRPIGGDRFEAPSPRLANAGEELAQLGVPTGHTLDVLEHIREHADAVARRFVELFLEVVWEPFEKAGRPPERWPEVRDALERLRPLAADALVAVFKLAMTDAVDEEVGRALGVEAGDDEERPARREGGDARRKAGKPRKPRSASSRRRPRGDRR